VPPSACTASASFAIRSATCVGQPGSGSTTTGMAMIIPTPPAARRRQYSTYESAEPSSAYGAAMLCAVVITRLRRV
jgi:hypothetical protein